MAWMLSLKAFFISTGVLFIAYGLKASVPSLLQFGATHMPVMWNFCFLCFKPPYLYVLVNGIIICIAASSRFHHSAAAADVDDQTEELPARPSKVPAYMMKCPPEVESDLAFSEPPVVYEKMEEQPVLEVKAVAVNGAEAIEDEDKKGIDDVGMESTWTLLKRMDSPEIPPEYLLPTEKRLVSTRFAQRKPPKASPEGGRSSRVAKPKRHETLENTWKAITEGRAMPLSRHMKKCDTWDNRGSVGPHEVKQSETFTDRTSQPVSSSTMELRKESSLSQDELNRRVEAFIKKSNEEMRLQRQESLNRWLEMNNLTSQ